MARTSEVVIPTLGKLLLRAKAVSATQLDAGLRQQVIYGGRLGTNLLELDYCNHDQIAQALGQLHGVPAAMTRHLRSADKRARELVPVGFCRGQLVVPLAFATARGRQLVVCMRDPKDAATIETLRELTGFEVIAAACPELSIYRLLKHFFALPLPARMLVAVAGRATPLPRSQTSPLDTLDPKEIAAAPHLDATEMSMPTLSLVGLDHASVERDPTQLGKDTDRLSLSELAERLREKRASEAPAVIADRSTEPPSSVSGNERERGSGHSDGGGSGQMRAVEAVSVSLAVAPVDFSKPVPLGPAPLNMEKALAAMKAASARSDVSSAVIGFLKSHFEGGLILVVRDGVAYGYRGFGGHFDEESVEAILVPLSPASPFKVAYHRKQRYIGAGVVDDKSLFGRFLLLFALAGVPELTIVEPVQLRQRVICLIYAHMTGEHELADNALEELEIVAAATGEAFLRLIKDHRKG